MIMSPDLLMPKNNFDNWFKDFSSKENMTKKYDFLAPGLEIKGEQPLQFLKNIHNQYISNKKDWTSHIG